jgi:hypothetical protein
MNISDFKNQLQKIAAINFIQPNGAFVPRHFHITEAAIVSKRFIDCGGNVSTQKRISFQIWTANDFQHKLSTEKLLQIITIFEKYISQEDLEIEFEYQQETISKYDLEIKGENFLLIPQYTNCIAPDKCGVKPAEMPVQSLTLKSCTPGSGCC